MVQESFPAAKPLLTQEQSIEDIAQKRAQVLILSWEGGSAKNKDPERGDRLFTATAGSQKSLDTATSVHEQNYGKEGITGDSFNDKVGFYLKSEEFKKNSIESALESVPTLTRKQESVNDIAERTAELTILTSGGGISGSDVKPGGRIADAIDASDKALDAARAKHTKSYGSKFITGDSFDSKVSTYYVAKFNEAGIQSPADFERLRQDTAEIVLKRETPAQQANLDGKSTMDRVLASAEVGNAVKGLCHSGARTDIAATASSIANHGKSKGTELS